MTYTIQNSTNVDMAQIFKLYKLAQTYQLNTFPDNLWPDFSTALIEQEIAEKRQWKIMIGDEIACIWAVTFEDPQIWEEKDKDPAIYLHRIATNPNFRGQHFVKKIAIWAKDYATKMDKTYIRMDTCGNNYKLINYYQAAGFNYLGQHKLQNSDQLPSHYHDALVCFFEIQLP